MICLTRITSQKFLKKPRNLSSGKEPVLSDFENSIGPKFTDVCDSFTNLYHKTSVCNGYYFLSGLSDIIQSRYSSKGHKFGVEFFVEQMMPSEHKFDLNSGLLMNKVF